MTCKLVDGEIASVKIGMTNVNEGKWQEEATLSHTVGMPGDLFAEVSKGGQEGKEAQIWLKEID